MYLETKAGPESLTWGEIPRPSPGPGEVLVRVRATAVTPTEFGWYPTFNTQDGAPRPFPVVPGHEFAGVVVQVGRGVEGLAVGDSVYGLNDWFANGALAEYTVAPAATLAPAPASLSPTQAAVVPISALTAWQALVVRGGVQSGQRVLIHGAAGGVGVFAMQLARQRHARIIATASAGNLDFVRALGADEVIDYRTVPFESVVRDVDFVLDTVGGGTLARSWEVLRPGGRLVTLAAPVPGASERDRRAFMLVTANPIQLREITRLLDVGEWHAFVHEEHPLSAARAAYARARQGRMRGKIALRVAS